jgi:hypothetical protein
VVHNPLLLLFGLVATAGFVVIAAGAVFLLVLSGGSYPTGECRAPDGQVREIVSNEAFARSFDRLWNELKVQALAGATSYHVTLTESEVTSRAAELLAESDVPVEEITICFHEGYAEAWGRGEVPAVGDAPIVGGLFEAGVRARGALDFSGPYARFFFSELDVETLPGFIDDSLRGEAEREINETLGTLPLDYTYQVTFAEGVAMVSVQP